LKKKKNTVFSDEIEISEFRIAPSGMAWKGVDSEGVTAIANTDIKWAQWMRVARQFQLRVGTKDHNKDKFEGFTREVRARSLLS
jgi:structure-specific recognition protein 1